MKTRFDKIGYPLYCDAGPHEGDTRIDLTISLYLSPQEYASYEGPESLHITLGDPGSEPPRNLPANAEPSRDRRPSTPGRGPPLAPAGRARQTRLSFRLDREGVPRWLSLNPRDYQAARERIKGNPVIAMMAASVVTVPLAELAHAGRDAPLPPHEPGQPRLRRRRGTQRRQPRLQPYPRTRTGTSG